MPRTRNSELGSLVVGRAIRTARQDAGLTQAQLAGRLGVSAPYVSEIETGRANLTVGQLWSLADALHAELHLELRPVVRAPAPTIPSRRGLTPRARR